MRYNNYHKHDHVSNIFTPDTNTHEIDYIKKCVEYGHTNYFTTNHGSFGDIFLSKTLCNEYGLRCIAGIEGYIVPNPNEKDRSNYHIIVIPKTDEARKKMNYVSSMANIHGYYYKPRFFISDLLNLAPDDIYITTACVAGLLRDENSINNIFMPLYEHFGNNVLLEVQNHIDPVQIEINKKALTYKSKYGLRLIAANDSHYIDNEGMVERLELLKGKHITYDSEDTFILDFPTAETMKERFLKQGILSEKDIDDAISNTLLFDECEEIQLDYSVKMPTIYPDLTPKERVDLLKKIINKNFSKIKKEEGITPEDYEIYKQGIRYEMKIIEDTNEAVHTADYFLFNTKNVDLAVNKYGGVLTRGGRGSCGSFYINKILGMTQLDRFKINLPLFPDRFMSTARCLTNRSMPDIDYNVMEQEPFVKASRELLGEHGCYPMYAPGTMQLSEAFRNVCRAKKYNYEVFNEVAKDIENHLDDPQWQDVLEEANKYVGTIISGSTHPCAHLLSNENILYEYGVTRLGDNLCVLITSSEADEYKVLKNDYLIVTVWKLIAETFNMIQQPIIPAKQLLDEIKDDKRIWDLFENEITCTLNQVDSDNGTQQAKRYGIKSFEDGAYIAAAIRPSFNSWRDRFLNHEKYSTGSKQLDEVLKMTNSYILYQENLMQYFEWLGVTPSESISLIKKISKKKIKEEDFSKLESRLKDNWVQKTGSIDMFDETWKMIQSCMSYGFCSAHAAATSLDMCYGAYLKVHYPLEYYTVCLNNYKGDEIRTRKLINELSYFNINLENIKFRHSEADYTCDKITNTIYKGLSSIKFISEEVGDILYDIKDENYDSFIDVLVALKSTKLNAKQLDILIKLNFFSEYGTPNNLLRAVEIFNELYEKKQLKIDKIQRLNLPLWIVQECCEHQTEKMFKGFDSVDLIKKLYANVEDIKTSLTQQLTWENELMGYIQTIIPNINKSYYYIQSIKDNWLTLYQLATGDTLKIKVRKNTLNSNPVSESQVIKVLEITQEKKWGKDENGNWIRKEEYEDILSKYSVLKS